jgi:flagellar assembly protein FliH
MSGERKRGFLRPSEDAQAAEPQVWGLPEYKQEGSHLAKETALNYDPEWMPDFSEEDQADTPELTVEELDNIRQDAYQEGLLQGQEAGFKQGYDKGKAQGIETGHQEGLEAGTQQGIADGEEVVKQHIDAFLALADQFAQPLDLMNAQVERQLVDMVLTLTKEIVHVEVQTNPQIILDTVKASVEALPIAGHAITLKLNPQDVAVIKESYGEDALAARSWTVGSEPSLARGDVQIEAGESSINYRMEERIRSVLSSFCGTNRHNSGEV